MRRLGSSLLFALVVAVSLGALAKPAAAAFTNPDCLGCHTPGGSAITTVTFTAPLVDKNTCWKCHWQPSHDGWTPGRTGNVATPYGYFDSASSPMADPAGLHAVHALSDPAYWQTDPERMGPNACGGCHRAADCAACHGETIPAKHTDHTLDRTTGTYAYPPVTVVVCAGVQPGQTLGSAVLTKSLTCVNASCHAEIGASFTAKPVCGSCHPTKTEAHGYKESSHDAGPTTGGCFQADCHASDLKTEHDKFTARHGLASSCAFCHTPIAGGETKAEQVSPWDHTCQACHTGMGASTGPHVVRQPYRNCVSTGCHAASGASDLHDVAQHGPLACDRCHGLTQQQTCKGAGCHTTSDDAMNVHLPNDHRWVSCLYCHEMGKIGGNLAGKVTNSSGAPVADAEVSVSGGTYSARTDANGNYSISAIGEGWRTVVASKAGYNVAVSRVNLPNVLTTTVNFTLSTTPGNGAVIGRVAGPDDILVDATVTVTPGGGTAKTDLEGFFAVANVTAGTCQVSAAKAGFDTLAKPVDVTAGGATSVLFDLTRTNIALGKTASASGSRAGYGPDRITDGLLVTDWQSGGAGTQWAKVDLGGWYVVDRARMDWMVGGHPAAYQVQFSTDDLNWVDAYATTSGTAGRVVRNLTPGTTRWVRILATAPSGASGYLLGELELYGVPTGPPPATVKGRVTDTNGRPIRYASISTSNAWASSDASGAYTLSPAAGTYSVVASATGHYPASATMTVQAGQWYTRDFTLTPRYGHIAGKVIDQYGSAVPGAVISCQTATWTATTGADGTYVIRDVLAGYSYQLTATKSGHDSGYRSVIVSEGTTNTADITITARPAILYGYVRTAAGAYVATATVSVSGGGTGTTSSYGYYSIGNLAPGTRTVTVSKPGWETTSATVVVTAGGYHSRDFILTAPPGTVSGYVRDASGAALADTTVTASPGGLTAKTDAAGAYSIPGLAPATYTLTASKNGYASSSISAAVGSGESVSLDFALARANLALGKAVSAYSYRTGYEPAKAVDGSGTTRWWSVAGGVCNFTVPLGGWYSADTIVCDWYGANYPTRWVLYVSADGSVWSTGTVSAGQSGAQTVAFGPRTVRYVRLVTTETAAPDGYSLTELQLFGFAAPAPTTGGIEGRVTSSGGGVAGARVSLTASRSTTTDAQGYFSLADLAPGSYLATVTRAAYDDATRTVSVSLATTTTADFALKRTNVARGKTATASSWRTGCEPYRVTDGPTGVAWWTPTSGTQWVMVDLASTYTLDTITADWSAGYYATAYKIQTSTNGTKWTTVYSTTAGVPLLQTYTFAARSARYVRVYATAGAFSSGYAIFEVEAFPRP